MNKNVRYIFGQKYGTNGTFGKIRYCTVKYGTIGRPYCAMGRVHIRLGPGYYSY